MKEISVAPKRTGLKRIGGQILARRTNIGREPIVEVVIDPTQWMCAAVNGQDKNDAGRTTRCTTRRGGSKAQVLGTTLTTATIAIQTELGIYVPTAQCHCVLSAGTKVYDAYAMRPDGRSKTMNRSS